METIVSKISSSLSKTWNKILNLENFFFCFKGGIAIIKIANTPKNTEDIARAFIAKSVYNFQITRDLIDRLHWDKSLQILCGWRSRFCKSSFINLFDVL